MHAQKAGTQRVVLAFIASFGCTGAALGDQQQNAYVYVDWSFSPSGPATIYSIDQDMWIAMPANGTQWVLTWKWGADPGHGGYLGFNTDAHGVTQALFSIWDALSPVPSPGVTCVAFGGEGGGYSCRRPFQIKRDHWYRLHLERASNLPNAVSWHATISEEQGWSGPSTTFDLGTINVNPKMNLILDNLSNFSEYFGDELQHCIDVPLSGQILTPPQTDWNASVKAFRTPNRSSFVSPGDCPVGGEPLGAMWNGGAVRVLVQSWASLYPVPPPEQAVLVFLGGDASTRPSAWQVLLDHVSQIIPPEATMVTVSPQLLGAAVSFRRRSGPQR
jgi:hypothetical protein